MKQQLRRVLPILLTVAMVITTWTTPLTSATVYAASQDEKSDVQNPGEDQENQNPEVKKAKTAGEDSVPESSVKEEPDSEAGKSGKNVELNELSDSSTHPQDNSDNISVDGKCADTEKDSETSNVISNNVSEKQKNSIKKENTSVAKTEVQKDTESVNPQEEPVSEDETQAEIRLTVKLSGTDYTVGEGASLESVIEENDIALGEITSIEFVSGTVTEEDLKYISSQKSTLKKLADLKVNLDGDLIFKNASGEASTTLPNSLFSTSSTSYMKALTNVELKGFTALGTKSLKLKQMTTLSIPDVVTIGDYALQDCSNLSEVDMSNVVTVGNYAFDSCKKLIEINLPNATTIGKNAFDTCSAVTEIFIPEVTSIGASAFAGIKNMVQVTIDSTMPPTVSGNSFSNVKAGSTLKVPEGSLENYLTGTEVGELYQTEQLWNKLKVVDEAYVNIIYKDVEEDKSSPIRYQILKKGDAIGETPFSITRNGYQLEEMYADQESETSVDETYTPRKDQTIYMVWGAITVTVADQAGNIKETIELPTDTYNELRDEYPELPEGAYQWNTEQDGSGRTILSDTKIYSDVTIYPVFEEIVNTTVKVNDGEPVGAAALGLAVPEAAAGNSITKLEVVSGRMTADDYAWLLNHCGNTNKDGNKLATLIIREGVESENKTFPGSGYTYPELTYVEIHGVETVETSGIRASKLETLILPDVKTVGNNPFGSFLASTAQLKTVEMPKIEEMGNAVFLNAFQGTEQVSLNFPNLKKIGDNAFKGCKAPLRITVNQIPEVGKDTFTNSTVTLVVPAEVYDAYYAEHGNNEYEGATLERGESLVTDVVTVKIDGTEYGAESLEAAVKESGIDADDVESLEFVSGTITADDLAYMKESTTYLKVLKMNLSETLKLTDKEGKESTVLPGSAFKSTRLESVELRGFTEIGGSAFTSCKNLTAVSMPNVETIGKEAFYWTDEYEEITLPASIKTLNDCGFGVAENGKKTIHVTIQSTTPPEVKGSPFKSAGSDSYIEVPEESLPNYLDNWDFSKVAYSSGDMLWGNLRVEDPAYHLITYTASYQTVEGGTKYSNIQYAYVKNGEAVTEDRISKGPSSNLGKELVGWNTKEDGTGTELTAETVPTESMTVYAQWAEPLPDVVTVKLNGTEVKGSSLEDAVRESKIAVKDLESVEFVSGKVTQTDLDYVSELTYVETFVMNLGEDLTLYGKDGNKTTVLDGENAALIFAAAPSGWSKPAVRSVTLGGITEIDKGGMKGSSMEILNVPDVVTVGTSAFAGFEWLESINLDKAEVIGESAFFNCKNLTNVTMNAAKTMKKGAFKYTNSLKKMTIPETIETIEDIEFGSTTQGNKNGTKITIKAMTPPTVDSNAFDGVASSGTTQSTVTVPHGALAAYVAQVNSKADVTKVLQIKDTFWKHLYLLEEGSYRIEYKVPQKSWMTQYAFVTEKGEITQDQIATVSAKDAGKEGYILTGWNTKQDGTGDMLEAGMTIESNMTVYPVWKEAVTLTFNVDGEVTTMEVVKGEAIGSNLPADPAKEGYEFQGWNTQPDGSGEAVTEETLAQEDMTVYAVFKEVEEPAPDPGEEILPEIDSIKVENGKVIITLKDKPANAPEAEDIRLQMNLNGTGNKDLTVKSFEYDGNKTIVLTFDKVAQTDKDQKFTVTVTLGGKSVTSDAVTVKAKDSSKTDENKKDDTKTKDNDTKTKDKDTKTQKAAQTGDETPVAEYFGLAVISLLAAVIVWRRKKSQ